MKIVKHLLIFLFLILFFSNAQMICTLSKDTLTFWFEQLIPSMFLCITCIQLLSETSFFSSLASLFNFLCPVFQINQDGIGLLISCLLLGCPSNVTMIQQAYEDHRITEKMALRLLYCTPTATVSFLIMNLGGMMFHSALIGFGSWLIQIFSCFVLLLITRNTSIETSPTLINRTQKKHPLTSALMKSGTILFLIGGYLLLFQMFSSLINLLLPSFLQELFSIISEFSYGCFLIVQRFPPRYAFVLISALCGFNGLCVQYQALSISEIRIPVLTYMMYRMIQAFIAALLATAAVPLLL